MQRDRYIKDRAEFCKLAIQDRKKAANHLRNLATGLENCRTASDVITALTHIFAVSEDTVGRDLVR
jgi:hypothetical protein